MIEAGRLLEGLSPHGFRLAWERWLGHQFNFDFVRPSPVDGVFEHVDVDSMGRRGEAVYCRVWLSPVRGHRLHFKPTPEVDELLCELGDPPAGHTLIRSPEDAADWERRVAQVAPERVRSLAQRQGHQVAIQIAPAREAATEYARRVREINDEPVMEYLVYQLRRRATPAQQRQAERFRAGAVCNEVARASECAAIAVALFGAEVDAEHCGFADEQAGRSCELKLRLNIVADILRLGVPESLGRSSRTG